jgi:hypothetical protein
VPFSSSPIASQEVQPNPQPLEHPAMLHVFISRYSGTISTIQTEKLDQSFESRITDVVEFSTNLARDDTFDGY